MCACVCVCVRAVLGSDSLQTAAAVKAQHSPGSGVSVLLLETCECHEEVLLSSSLFRFNSML